jgi:hypothetical protein
MSTLVSDVDVRVRTGKNEPRLIIGTDEIRVVDRNPIFWVALKDEIECTMKWGKVAAGFGFTRPAPPVSFSVWGGIRVWL